MKPETIESLKSQLSYNRDSGIFTWKVKKNSYGGTIVEGSIAGTLKDGYVQIRCDQKQYRAHRLAWLFEYGEFPKNGFEIDHINGVRSDNRIANLRLATRSQNNMNTGESKSNSSGKKGVHFAKDIKKWHARIVINRKTILLGNFLTKEEAIQARENAEKKYFGEFIRN